MSNRSKARTRDIRKVVFVDSIYVNTSLSDPHLKYFHIYRNGVTYRCVIKKGIAFPAEGDMVVLKKPVKFSPRVPKHIREFYRRTLV